MKIHSAAPPQVSFFDTPFCWNFPIARRLSEAKAYIETPSPLTSATGNCADVTVGQDHCNRPQKAWQVLRAELKTSSAE